MHSSAFNIEDEIHKMKIGL